VVELDNTLCTFNYDLASHLGSESVDANNGLSTTMFSNRGLVSATQDQLGALTSYTQDPNGNTILRVDARQCARGKAAPKSCTLVHDLADDLYNGCAE